MSIHWQTTNNDHCSGIAFNGLVNVTVTLRTEGAEKEAHILIQGQPNSCHSTKQLVSNPEEAKQKAQAYLLDVIDDTPRINPEGNIWARLRNGGKMELNTPTLGSVLLPIEEFMLMMEKASEAMENYEVQSSHPPEVAEPLTYRSILFRVLREANQPLTKQQLCERAKPLIEKMGAKGKTPMASFTSKLYIAVQVGEIRRDGDTFLLPTE